MHEQSGYLTVADVAKAIGVRRHHIDRLMNRGELAFKLAGRMRLVAVGDIPAARTAAERRGYLTRVPASEPTCAAVDAG